MNQSADFQTQKYSKLTLLLAIATLTTFVNGQNIDLSRPQEGVVAQITGYRGNSVLNFIFSPAGDTNGDGIQDFLIGSPYLYVNNKNSGRTYRVLGSSSFEDLDLLSFQDSNVRGMMAYENPAKDTGLWVSSAGDFNGDGLEDFITKSGPSNTYLVYGDSAVTNLDLSTINTSNIRGCKITGVTTRGTGVGDINNDGYDDIALANMNYDLPDGNSHIGIVYVIFGRANMENIDLLTFSNSPQNGFIITGYRYETRLGQIVGPAGDFNNDGYADMIVGSKLAFQLEPGGPAHECYYMVIKGRNGVFPDLNLEDSNYILPQNCLAIVGSLSGYPANEFIGSPKLNRDFNGDGFSDLLIVDTGQFNGDVPGKGYVVYGRDDNTTHIYLANLSLPDGFRMEAEPETMTGIGWGWTGDVNNDGLGDLAVCASNVSHNGLQKSGSTYLVYGRTTATQSLNLGTNFQTGIDGFRIDGPVANPYSFPLVSAVGDVNNDEYDDFLLGLQKNLPGGGMQDIGFLIFGHAAPAGITDWTRWN